MRPMRSMFHQHRRSVPSLNVASMPDLIFTVLFFFMIVTHMRSDEVKVRLEVPQGHEVQKLTNRQALGILRRQFASYLADTCRNLLRGHDVAI